LKLQDESNTGKERRAPDKQNSVSPWRAWPL
jgi:hypothetical protein